MDILLYINGNSLTIIDARYWNFIDDIIVIYINVTCLVYNTIRWKGLLLCAGQKFGPQSDMRRALIKSIELMDTRTPRFYLIRHHTCACHTEAPCAHCPSLFCLVPLP